MASPFAALISLGSAFFFGLSVVCVKRALRGTSALGASTATTAINVAVLLAVYAVTSQAPFTTEALIFFMTAGLFARALARTLNYLSVERIGASAASTLSNASPLLALPLAYVMLHETLGLHIVAGAILIAIGVVLLGFGAEEVLSP